MQGPTRGATDGGGDHWQARPGFARAIRILVKIAPLAAALAVTWSIRPFVPRPSGLFGIVVFLVPLVFVGVVVAMLTERAVGRLLPLANLLSLSLVFPDQAPSRYGVALRTGSAKRLARQVADVQANQLSSDETVAAQQLLDLVAALGKHEPRTAGHTERVRAYSILIGEELGLPKADLEKLHWAVLLHDIGKLAVPAHLLNKPGRPTTDEWEIIQKHPAIGAVMVEPLADWLGPWRHSAGQHHERWDGDGYPLGLEGTEISMAGRIVAVADAYDTITAARSYKKPMAADDARQELVRCSGAQFDPAVVRAFLNISVGNVRSVAGRFAWLAHVPAALQPVTQVASGAISATGSAGIAAVAVVTGSVAVPAPAPQIPVDVAFVQNVELVQDQRDTEPAFTIVLPTPTPTPTPMALAPSPTPTVGEFVIEFDPTSTAVAATPTALPTTAATPSPSAASTPSPSPTAIPTATPTALPAPTATPTPATTATPTATPTSGVLGEDCEAALGGATNLVGADLRNCPFGAFDLSDLNLSRSNLDGADFTGANLVKTRFDKASMVGAILVDADLTTAKLHDVDLTAANLSGALIDQAHFVRSTLVGANLSNATITDTNFAEADLGATSIGGAYFGDSDFGNATFLDAVGTPVVDQSDFTGATCPDGSAADPLAGCW